MKSYLISIEYKKDWTLCKETIWYNAKNSIWEAYDTLREEFKKAYWEIPFLITSVYSEKNKNLWTKN